MLFLNIFFIKSFIENKKYYLVNILIKKIINVKEIEKK